MKRTRVLSLLLAVLVAIAFASCRPDEPRTAPRGTSASGAQAVEEWLATWQEDLEVDDPGAVVRASERAFAEHPELAQGSAATIHGDGGGFGLSPHTIDPSAPARESLAALRRFAALQSQVTELRA